MKQRGWKFGQERGRKRRESKKEGRRERIALPSLSRCGGPKGEALFVRISRPPHPPHLHLPPNHEVFCQQSRPPSLPPPLVRFYDSLPPTISPTARRSAAVSIAYLPPTPPIAGRRRHASCNLPYPTKSPPTPLRPRGAPPSLPTHHHLISHPREEGGGRGRTAMLPVGEREIYRKPPPRWPERAQVSHPREPSINRCAASPSLLTTPPFPSSPLSPPLSLRRSPLPS